MSREARFRQKGLSASRQKDLRPHFSVHDLKSLYRGCVILLLNLIGRNHQIVLFLAVDRRMIHGKILR